MTRRHARRWAKQYRYIARKFGQIWECPGDVPRAGWIRRHGHPEG